MESYRRHNLFSSALCQQTVFRSLMLACNWLSNLDRALQNTGTSKHKDNVLLDKVSVVT